VTATADRPRLGSPSLHPGLTPEHGVQSPAVEVSKRPNPIERVRLLWQYRELVVNLTRKELKVKYKTSVLGFLWSLLNPLMYLVVFSLVFGIISKVSVPYFGIFFLSGLLAWNLFAAAIGGGTAAIVGNAQLVTKVWFPRESLVIASILAGVVHFFLQGIVLLAALAVFRRAPDFQYLPIMGFSVIVLLIFATALGIALSAINVYLRDTQHLVEVLLLAWFWVSPVAWSYGLVRTRYGASREWIAALNPVLTVVVTFQRTLWNPNYSLGETSDEYKVIPPHHWGWYMTHLGVTALVSLGLLYGALALFSRLEDNFAEEI
jgi:ABC-2 type transport system permease protein